MDFKSEKLQYSYVEKTELHPLPETLKDSLQLIFNFLSGKINNKLCLVFPSKDRVAQWLTIPTILSQINSDFAEFNGEIINAYKQFKPGTKLLLNNEAIVEWVSIGEIEKKGKSIKVAYFRTKHSGESSGLTISIPFKQIIKLQTTDRKVLSAANRVMSALPKRNISPLEQLLNIETFGNADFIKNSICLVSTLKAYNDSISNMRLNNAPVEDYFKAAQINDSGEVDVRSPFLISNNLRNLALYVTLSNVSKIIIDGYSAIRERAVDFNDIDAKKIPTILITDLSEVENFERITDYGFDFFNFTPDHLNLNGGIKPSPFNLFYEKIGKFSDFKLIKEICRNEEIENLTKLIHSIDNDDSVKELVNLKILLIQLTNRISRIVHPINSNEATHYRGQLNKIESYYKDHRYYLGGSLELFDKAISTLKSVIEIFIVSQSDKCSKLFELLARKNYDYIICATSDEALYLSQYFRSVKTQNYVKVISVADVNNSLLKGKPTKAILTGWAKSSNVSFLLSCFIFSELTFLFYEFEDKYLNSLQRRNRRLSNNIKSTINKAGIRVETEHGFSNHFEINSATETSVDNNLDVVEFELKFDNSLFSKYIVRGNQEESVKARRVEFKNNSFIYLTDSHSLLVLDNFNTELSKSPHIHKSRIETLRNGDIIAFIKTERELLSKIVERQTTPAILLETTGWINLWKHLLKNHYKLLNYNFSKLVGELKERGCSRDQMTIRSWLFDELRIGPRKDDDLISIAIMTNGTELYNNIQKVRNAIRQMTGWRMKASDYVIEQLKAKIKTTHATIQVNSTVDFEDLGEVEILEIAEIKNTYDNVDIRYANRLLEKIKL